jgi:hypothetical protein
MPAVSRLAGRTISRVGGNRLIVLAGGIFEQDLNKISNPA